MAVAQFLLRGCPTFLNPHQNSWWSDLNSGGPWAKPQLWPQLLLVSPLRLTDSFSCFRSSQLFDLMRWQPDGAELSVFSDYLVLYTAPCLEAAFQN